jgi:mRNA-degrading endonuclease YafQ of YafQ-DinJ toxin-antitoxin module
MYRLKLHKEAQKSLKKTQKHIREKAFECIVHLKNFGAKDCPFPVEPLKGFYKKFKYYEAKIQQDYRIFFRFEDDVLFIRKAGAHNELGTG